MHGLLGLSRDPFAPLCDGELYWESPARAEVRESIEGLLRAERGVWLRGEPDSGRRSLLGRAVAAVAGPLRPVVWCDAFPAARQEGLLPCLARATGCGAQDQGMGLVAAVYAELVDGFCRGGPAVVLRGDASGADDREELGLLSALKLVGKPLVLLALWGAGEPPVDGLRPVDLPGLSALDVRQFLSHRLTACGGPDIFSPARLEELAAQARGLGHALELARGELGRALFLGRPSKGSRPDAPSRSVDRVLDPSELAEVDRLLDALGPGNTSP